MRALLLLALATGPCTPTPEECREAEAALRAEEAECEKARLCGEDPYGWRRAAKEHRAEWERMCGKEKQE